MIGLYPLMPNRMTVVRDEQGRLYYEYQRTWDEPARPSSPTVPPSCGKYSRRCIVIAC